MHQWNFKGVDAYLGRFFIAVAFVCAFALYHYAFAATIVMYSDTISTSAPGKSANHTITFTTKVAIPPNGFIRFTPDDGYFTIPATDFDLDNVDFLVDTGSGFNERIATGTPSATEDGVSITSGTSGNVEVTLNSSQGIPANAKIKLLLGKNTPNATSTDLGIFNPSATGTFAYRITAGDSVTQNEVTGRYAIVETVHVGDVDTHETIPPVRYDGAPTGDISGTSISVELSLRTDEFAHCRYSPVPNVPYFSIPAQFSQVSFSVIHTKVISVSATTSSTTYNYYIRCIDDEGNINTDDYIITFTVLPIPEGVPGAEGDTEGQGSGTGSGSGDANPGNGGTNGSGDGGGGSGGGGGGGGSGGGSGSSSGGSNGGGGFEGVGLPYQSGDGQVIITGYAFPQSTIVALVDGKIAGQVTSNSDGLFTITLDQIARGAYSFGVYGIDKNNVKSSTFSTTFTVTGARATALSNINVMPSIKVTPDPVEVNSTVTVSGYTIPNATVTIENQNDKSSASLKSFTVTSDKNGAWSVAIPTNGFTKGTYKVRAKAKQNTGLISTNFSGYTFYGVGQAKVSAGSSDLNRDGKVNLTDFSILLFWWNSNGGNSNPSADINGDGKVSLTDFSIMIFNWTG